VSASLVLAGSMSAFANNPSCQAGTGTTFFTLGSPGLPIDCESQWPVTGTAKDTSYNLEPSCKPGTINSGGCTPLINWQLTAHIAGYSGDGIHSFHGDCTGSSLFPQITAHSTSFGS
jgi:hypothetical protein